MCSRGHVEQLVKMDRQDLKEAKVLREPREIEAHEVYQGDRYMSHSKNLLDEI